MNLTRAIIVAATAHEGQTDKGGNPYILHPLRMMLKARDEKVAITAMLHDVVEDTEWSLEALRFEGFSDDIINAIDCLTRRKDESYDDFILRCKENELAKQVKLLDLDDNRDIFRIPNPTKQDYDRLDKHNKAIKLLLS